MRTYETIFIVNPQLAGDEYTAIVDKFKGVLTDQQAEILKVDEWGTKRLAYPVKKNDQGIYVLVVFSAENSVVKEFERRMRLDESIIKFQTLLLEGGFKMPVEVEVPAAVEADTEEAETKEADTEVDDAADEAAE